MKKEIYLADFRPDPAYLQNQGYDQSKILVVVRPPAPWTAYHRFENTLFCWTKSCISLLPFIESDRAQIDWFSGNRRNRSVV